MKKIIKILIIALIVVLQGCIRVDVEYGISPDHTVHLVYRVTIYTEELDFQETLEARRIADQIIAHYTREGFVAVEESLMSSPITFELRLEKENSSFKEAYAKLQEIMVNSRISFFTAIDMTREVTQYEIGLTLNMETDIYRMLEAAGINELPPLLRREILEELQESELTLILAFPHTNIVRHSYNVSYENIGEQTIITAPLNTDQKTTIEIMGRISLENDRVLNMTIEESIERTENQIQTLQILMFAGVGGAIIGIGGILFYLKKVKKQETKGEKE